jgi:alcohol dehydrogenase (cytochrome c)
MRSLRAALLFIAGALISVVVAPVLAAQGVDATTLLHQPEGSWPTYHGDYSGKRHSGLTQISPQNVSSLKLAWAFQTDQTAAIKSSPLFADGILYFTVPNIVWAVDARSGHQIWRYTYPPNHGIPIGNRGVGMYKGWLFFMSPDAHLVSLNAKDGAVRWDIAVADSTKGYFTTMAPLIAGNHVLVGVSGDPVELTGYLRSVDPETGATQWQWNATPPLGTPHSTTGGMPWITGTYDPVLNLLYWGTGNPTPILNASSRPGNDLYTCSIVALDLDSGKLVWAFQPSPHDTHDWDAVEVPVLVDGEFRGRQRKLLLQASRNGYFFVLDRVDGKSLLTTPFGPVNWSLGVDEHGSPLPNPDKEASLDGRLVAPDENGLTNFRSPSFDPKTGLLIVDAHPSYSLFYFSKAADGTHAWTGDNYDVWGKSVIEAIDYQTGKIRWSHEIGPGAAGAGALTTDSGLTFTGDALGNFLALNTSDGKTLWHAGSGSRIESAPITYQIDGNQFVLTSSGTMLFAWVLSPSI